MFVEEPHTQSRPFNGRVHYGATGKSLETLSTVSHYGNIAERVCRPVPIDAWQACGPVQVNARFHFSASGVEVFRWHAAKAIANQCAAFQVRQVSPEPSGWEDATSKEPARTSYAGFHPLWVGLFGIIRSKLRLITLRPVSLPKEAVYSPQNKVVLPWPQNCLPQLPGGR
jgi:hypothetical protein